MGQFAIQNTLTSAGNLILGYEPRSERLSLFWRVVSDTECSGPECCYLQPHRTGTTSADRA
jgi:hypothetical protein